MRILIADDSTLTRLDLRSILESAGHEVCAQARDGEEAVAAALATEPDLAILDVRMPSLDGIQAARQMLAGRGLPIVLLTGHLNEWVADRAAASGIRAAYVGKPFSDAELLRAVDDARRQHRATRGRLRLRLRSGAA